MVKNANTNTANQMVSNQSMLKIHKTYIACFSPTNILDCNFTQLYGVTDIGFSVIVHNCADLYCSSRNKEEVAFTNEDGPYFLFKHTICGKSGGNLFCDENN